MLSMGKEEYVKATYSIINLRSRIQNFIETEIPELSVCGDPQMNVLGIQSESFNILCLAEHMGKLGWTI